MPKELKDIRISAGYEQRMLDATANLDVKKMVRFPSGPTIVDGIDVGRYTNSEMVSLDESKLVVGFRKIVLENHKIWKRFDGVNSVLSRMRLLADGRPEY